MIHTFLIASCGLLGVGIVALFLLPGVKTSWIFSGFGAAGSLMLLISGIAALFGNGPLQASLWSLPNFGTLTITVDHLSGFFLAVTALVAVPAAIFAGNHLSETSTHNARVFASLYLALLITIILLIVASNIFLFMVAWEAMSILIYLLISGSEGERPGYLMLAVGEGGTLAIAVAFLLLSGKTGSPGFGAIKANSGSLGEGIRWAIFMLSFFGFGVKAGLIPLNFWLSRTYSAAPPALTPLLAGATLNLGLYGIIRVNADLLPVTIIGPGIITLGIGTLTALIGILYATIEDDLKCLLAHSSIENAGIITAGLGAAFLFSAEGNQTLAAIAFIAAFYHLLNHSVFKTLLFMGAGSVERASKTRSLDHLGGILKYMPWTGLFVLVGMLAIAAMPPFNGFVSEWLTLQALLRGVELTSTGIKIVFMIAGAGLALTAGLAVTCFVRAFSMGFLGKARSKMAHSTREVGKIILAPMAFLALAALALGVLPTYIISAMDHVVKPLTGVSAAEALVPPFFSKSPPVSQLPPSFAADFHNLGAQVGQNVLPGPGLAIIHRGGTANPVVYALSTSYMLVALLVLLGLSAGLIWFLVARRRKSERCPRWDGGIKDLLPEMTYTATGFAQPVRVIFEAILRPATSENRIEAIAEHFRLAIYREREEVHLIDRLVLHPLSAGALWVSEKLAHMHNGRVNTYATYALLALIVILLLALYH